MFFSSHADRYWLYAATLRPLTRLALASFIIPMAVQLKAQTEPSLDTGRSPLVAATPTLSQEIWENTDIDYFTEDVNVDEASINIAEAITSIISDSGGEDTLQVVDGQGCDGFTSTRPAYRFEWNRDDISEMLPIRIFVSGEQPTLVIREPDGDWLCSAEMALLDIPELRSGKYHVWVGSKQSPSGNTFSARLYIAFGDQRVRYSPQALPPPCCTGLRFSNPANEDSNSALAYLDHRIISSAGGGDILQVSIDAILRGTSGERFLLEVTPFDPETGTVIPVLNPDNPNEPCAVRATYCDSARLRYEELRLDYSGTSARAVEFDQIDLTALGFTRDSYYFVFTITSLDVSGNLAQPEVIYEFSSSS